MNLPTPLLTGIDVSDLLHVSTRRLNQLIDANQIPHVRLPTGEVRFVPDELSHWSDGLSVRPPSEVNATGIL